MDLQNFTIQVPEAKRKNMTYPTQKPSLYPVALVVGQFSEYYRTYTPQELQCYPINTALTNPDDLMKRLLEEKMRKEVAVASGSGVLKATEEVAEEAVAKSISESSESSDEDSDGDESVVRRLIILLVNNVLTMFYFVFQDTDTSSESDCDVNDDDVCCVCTQTQFTSPNNVPELFVKCTICMKMGKCLEMTILRKISC